MPRNRTVATVRAAIGLSLLICATVAAAAEDKEVWSILIGRTLARDQAIRLAIEDLTRTGADHGLAFTVVDETTWPAGNVLLVGDADRNTRIARLLNDGVLGAEVIGHSQGYAIRTTNGDGRRIVVVTGGSVVGDVYGLYWVWDRIRVHKRLPDINTRRIPTMEMRVGATWGRRGRGGSTKDEMRAAIRYSTNWVSGPAVLDLVPWDSKPEATANAKNRARTRKLIGYAHRLHLKYFSFANEFTYHPSLLKEYGATLSPEDPRLWQAVQGKFRKLFTALPELDGIELCNADISGFWDDYAAYDLLTETPECEWSYAKRFHTFVKNVHDVVVGEFDKTYFHFTWGLTTQDQHYQPAVFRDIFTAAIPTKNLYLMPKITRTDRWWHQPYNTTFNQTPHKTIVCFETMNYYESGRSSIFPTFSGRYFAAGLQTLLLPEASNLVGTASLAGGRTDDWRTRGIHSYVLYRLAWDPYENIEMIARDFCAIHFGPDAADAMAGIYLLSAAAYKYGLHIEPVSYGQYNSFIHMRVGTFPVQGYPDIDGGREHLAFLRKIYLRCKPWRTETLDDLDHGLAVARRMVSMFKEVRPLVTDAKSLSQNPLGGIQRLGKSGQPSGFSTCTKLARDIERRLDMTHLLIATNNGYVRTIFAFFDYLDQPTDTRHNALAKAYANLVETRSAFTKAPGFGYKLFGVDQLLANAKSALDDILAAKAALEHAPTRAQLEQTIANQQKRYTEVLEQYADEAVHFAHFEAIVDGRDIIEITGDTYRINHLRWDGPRVKEFTILTPLPDAPVTVVPKDNYSRPIHPFVLEHPTRENNYTLRLYLDDLPGGQDWVNCDLYYFNKRPEELGLKGP